VEENQVMSSNLPVVSRVSRSANASCVISAGEDLNLTFLG